MAMSSNTQKNPYKRLRLRPLLEKVTRSFCHSSKRNSASNDHPRLVISRPMPLSSSNLAITQSFTEEPLLVSQEEEEEEEDIETEKCWAPQENAETLAILESRDTPEEKSTTWKFSRESSVYTLVCRPLSNSTHRTFVTAAERTSLVGSFSSRSSSELKTSPTNAPPNSKYVSPISSSYACSPTGSFQDFSRISRGLSNKRTITRSYEKAKFAQPSRRGSKTDEPKRLQSRRSAAYIPVHAPSDFTITREKISTKRRAQPSPKYYQRPSVVKFHRQGAVSQQPAKLSRTSAAYTPVHAASDFSRILDQKRPIEYVATSVRPLTPLRPYEEAMLQFYEEPSPKSHAVPRFSPTPFLLDNSDSNSDSDSDSTLIISSRSNVQMCDFQTFLATSRIASARAACIDRIHPGPPFKINRSRSSSKPSPRRPQSRSQVLMRKLGTYVKPVPAEIVCSNSYSRWGSWSDGSQDTCDSTLIGSVSPSSRFSSFSSSAKRSHSRTSFRDGQTSLWGWEDGRRAVRPSHMPISPGMKRYQVKSQARESQRLGSGARRRDGIYFGNVETGKRSPVMVVSAGTIRRVDCA